MTIHRQLTEILKSILRLKRKKILFIADLFPNFPDKTSHCCWCHQVTIGKHCCDLCFYFITKECWRELLWECCEECLKRLPLQQRAAGDLFTAILRAASRAVVLNLVGGTEPHQFQMGIHQILLYQK